MRVAVLGGYFTHWAGPEARQAVQLAARALDATDIVELAGAQQARAAFVITAAEGGALHRRRLVTHYDYYEPYSRDRLVAGSLVPAAWQQAQRVRHRVYRDALALVRALRRADRARHAGARHAHRRPGPDAGRPVPAGPRQHGLLTQPISCLGLPVCAAPVWPGIGADAHLPLGVQLIAAPWRESDCLLAARRLERAGVATVRQVMPTPFLRPQAPSNPATPPAESHPRAPDARRRHWRP